MIDTPLTKIQLLNPDFPNKSTGIINGKSSGILNWNDIAYPKMYDLYQTLLSNFWKPQDVSANNEGYDIRSISPEGLKRYIEVKGRSAQDGNVMVSENEMNRLAQLGDAAWLYIVINCKNNSELYRIQNPFKALKFELKTKGVQYFLPMAEWKQKINA